MVIKKGNDLLDILRYLSREKPRFKLKIAHAKALHNHT